MFIYGYCLLQGASLLSDGSEMLLEVLNPGLIGGEPCEGCQQLLFCLHMLPIASACSTLLVAPVC